MCGQSDHQGPAFGVCVGRIRKDFPLQDNDLTRQYGGFRQVLQSLKDENLENAISERDF
jgi:hypothetical protein